jgi:hypothetical protein
MVACAHFFVKSATKPSLKTKVGPAAAALNKLRRKLFSSVLKFLTQRRQKRCSALFTAEFREFSTQQTLFSAKERVALLPLFSLALWYEKRSQRVGVRA